MLWGRGEGVNHGTEHVVKDTVLRGIREVRKRGARLPESALLLVTYLLPTRPRLLRVPQAPSSTTGQKSILCRVASGGHFETLARRILGTALQTQNATGPSK